MTHSDANHDPDDLSRSIHDGRGGSLFAVVVHDVTPLYLDELRAVFATVRGFVGSQFSCAVVPRWHGREFPGEETELTELLAECGEQLLHGWTHFRDRRPGLISRLTHRSDEFGGLSIREVQDRIDSGRDALQRLTGVAADGLVPPAWRLPVASTGLTGISYVMRYGRLESCADERVFKRLATWSFDWGWLEHAAWGANGVSSAKHRLCSSAPCVAIHPVDVARGWLPRIARLIRRFLNRGYRPTTPSRLLMEAAAS